MKNPDQPKFYNASFDDQIAEFINQHREMILESLAGLTENEARQELVTSKTTLLGIVKHAIFVEQVWFQEAYTGKNRTELGIPEGPDESFDLTEKDSISSIQQEYREQIEISNSIASSLSSDAKLFGNRRGEISVRWMYLHLLRELAQHCGHADILREQILASRNSPN